MSVAIQSNDDESLRTEVEAEYKHADHDVPDESKAGLPSASMYSFEHCC
ncbi:hypothetical protein [Halorussus salinus]|nr:hypothetical protein [Halorussus salinus]